MQTTLTTHRSKPSKKSARVILQTQLTEEARALEFRVRTLLEPLKHLENEASFPNRRKGSTRAYAMWKLEQRLLQLWTAHRDTREYRTPIREAMGLWKSLEHAIWRLAMTSRRVAHVEAHRLSGRFMDADDLRQEGYIGLLRAAKRFDPEKGVKFDTYARWWVRAEITRAIEQRGRAMRIPGGAAEQLRNIRKLMEQLDKENIEYTLRDIAQELGLDERRVHSLLSVGSCVSLETEVDTGPDSRTLGNTLVDEEVKDPEAIAELSDRIRRLQTVLIRDISPRQLDVLTRRYGLEDGQFRTLRQIGLEMGISRERVRQIEIGAFAKIRSNHLFREKRRPLN
jgi:RNA polymerase sigma factor (sigma-70 family)